MKRKLLVCLLVLAVSVAAHAGNIESPGVTGNIESPGVTQTGNIESPGFASIVLDGWLFLVSLF